MILNPALGVNIKDCGAHILAGKRWRVSEKVDGVRRLFYKPQNGPIIAYSRSGKEDIYLGHITEFLESPWFPVETVYDCEIVDREAYFSHTESFVIRTVTTGKLNQKSHKDKQSLMALCFDVISLKMANSGDDRTDLLYDLFARSPVSDPIIMIRTLGVIEGEDSAAINSFLDQVYANKGEGIMLMDLSSPYIQGRSATLIKIKRSEEFIGEIVDIEMGREDSKIGGGVAAVICLVTECTVPVRVGTGMTFLMRKAMAGLYETGDLIGKKVEIEAFCVTTDISGNRSLSMPVFKRLCM